jgi:hypothetical protein
LVEYENLFKKEITEKIMKAKAEQVVIDLYLKGEITQGLKNYQLWRIEKYKSNKLFLKKMIKCLDILNAAGKFDKFLNKNYKKITMKELDKLDADEDVKIMVMELQSEFLEQRPNVEL